MENHFIKLLITSDKLKLLIVELITVLSIKALKTKALPRRARGEQDDSPVPSCSI